MKKQGQASSGIARWTRVGRGSSRALLLSVLVAGLSRPAVAGLFDDNTPSSKQTRKPNTPLPPLDNNPLSPSPSNGSSNVTSKPNSQIKPKPVEPAKLAIPADAERKAAEKQVKDILGDDLAKAKTPADKTKIATQMLQTADGTAEAAGRYVLLRDAENLAAEAADVETAIAANNSVVRTFEPDFTAGAIDALQKFSRLTLEVDAEGKLCEMSLGSLGQAIAANRFDAARQFGKLALAFAHKTTDKDLSDRAASMMGSISFCESEFARVAPSEAILKKTPDDPSANAAIGRFECFVKGNWSVGLPMLVKGSNETLKHAAVDELKPPATAVEQSAVADAWWGMTDGLPPAIQANVRAHAASLYARAEEGLSGLSKLKAEQRIAQVQGAAPKPQVATARNPKTTKTLKPALADDGTSTTTETIEVNGPADVIKAVPPEMFPNSLIDWTVERQGAVNEVLRQKLYRQKGTFNLVIQELLPSSLRMNSRSVLIGKVSFRLMLHFDADARDQLQGLRVGAPCTVTGEIYYVRFEGMELVCYMDHCTRLR
jgi:hypothetical protein